MRTVKRRQARLFDLQVRLDEIQLTLQRHFLLTGVVQRRPQQIAQASDHAIGEVHVSMNKRRDGVERVEKKVRVQLHLEDLQLRLGKLGLELR